MKNNANQNTGSTTYTQKLAATAGSLSALCMVPLASQAAVVHQTTPLTIAIDDAPGGGGTATIDWDVDGNSASDFYLQAFRTINYTSGGGSSSNGLSIPTGSLQLNSNGQAGQGMVQGQSDPVNRLGNLSLGFQVGPALSSVYQWSPSGVGNRTLMTSSDYNNFIRFPFSGFGPEYIGFRFTGAGNQTLYGWAEISLNELGGTMTINEWAYEDSGAGIAVGQVSAVPAPPAILSMLSGLALGAGGLLRSRRQRKAASDSDAREAGRADA